MAELLIALAVFASDLLGRFRRWLTIRRVLGIVAFLILLLCLRGLIEMGFAADLPFIFFGIDWGLAIEVSALIIVLSARDRLTFAVYVVKRWLLQRKPVQYLFRRGSRRSSRFHPAATLLPPPPEDEPGAWAVAMA